MKCSSLFFRVGIVALALHSVPGRAQSTAPANPLSDPALERRVNDLLQQMTLDEKVGQLVHYSAGKATGPGTSRVDYKEQIAKGQLGSLENLVGAAKVNEFQRIAMEKSRLHIPLLFALDVIHGYRTVFPVPLAMASTWDPSLVEQAARVASKEATAEGVRQTYSPMVDIARDARWGRIVEGAGEDPYLGSAMSAAYVRGYQGNLSDPQSMVACLKHYVGYGAAEGGRDYNTAEISERTLRQVYLPPFKAGVDAGAGTLMAGFNTLNGVPVSANAFTLTTVLRGEWGFRGFVMSDWGSVGELMSHGIANDGQTITRKALVAGVDIDHESSVYTVHLANLVKSGVVPLAVVDEAVRRVLRVKFALGLFENPYTPEPKSGGRAPLDPEHLKLARTVAERSFVLLQNNPVNGQKLLPLRPGKQRIALIGPMSDSGPDMLGPWIAEGNASDVTTLRTSLSQRVAADGGTLHYAKGTDILNTTDTDIAGAVELAKNSDVVLLALGENAEQMSGEAASRVHIDFPGKQQALFEAVVATGKPVVLVVFSGRPLELTWASSHVAAILQAWFPGVQAGPALTRVLFGDVNPGGKLTVSMPRSLGQLPLYYNALNTGRPPVGIDLTRLPKHGGEKYFSRYIDELNDPLFPFGHGLSYTQFGYSALTLSTARMSAATLNAQEASSVIVSTTVSNTGTLEGDEVVQLYIRLRGTSVARPVKELKGFRRISLKAGESLKVDFPLGRDELAFWGLDMQERVEPAEVTVWVGTSSAEGPSARLEIGE